MRLLSRSCWPVRRKVVVEVQEWKSWTAEVVSNDFELGPPSSQRQRGEHGMLLL